MSIVGNRLLHQCPRRFSCGTVTPLWSDDALPNQVGVPTTINVYGSGPNGECKYPPATIKVNVMRCSLETSHDLIYQYIGSYYNTCAAAFCGTI